MAYKEISEEKRLFINMTAQIVSFLVSAGISFFLTPYVVEKLGKEAYGFVGLANDFVGYAQIIVTALNSMASRFITISVHRKQYESANQYFSSVIFANLIITLVLLVPAVLVVCFLDKIVNVPTDIVGDVRILWALLFLESLIGIASSVYGSATYVKNRLELSSLRSIESNILKVIVLVGAFTLFKPHVYYLGISALVCTLYCVVTNVHYTHMLLPEIHVRRSHFNLAKIKELLAAGVWNSITRISSLLSTELDLLITNLFVGAAAMGTVSVAKSLPTMILSVFGTMASVFMPQLNISYANDDYDHMREQLIFSIKLLGMVACIPVACVYVFGDTFFSLWVPGEDAKLLQGLAIISMLAFPLSLALEPLWNIFTVTNKIKQSSLFMIANSFLSILAVFILLNFATTDEEKMYIVVGVSSIFSVIRSITFLPLYGAKCVGLPRRTFYGPIVKNLVALAAVTAVAVVLRKVTNVHTWVSLAAVCCVVGVIALTMNFFILLTGDERRWLLNRLLKREA
jgi:O-antigen/teichoic acid export membrane protein